MRKILYIAALLLVSVVVKAQTYGSVVEAKDSTLAGNYFEFKAAERKLDEVTYHEFSEDSISWHKTQTLSDVWVRFSNNNQNDWFVWPVDVATEFTEADPVYLASYAAQITAADIVKLSNLSGVNTGDQDLSDLVTNGELTDSLDNYSLLRSDTAGFTLDASQIENLESGGATNLSELDGSTTAGNTFTIGLGQEVFFKTNDGTDIFQMYGYNDTRLTYLYGYTYIRGLEVGAAATSYAMPTFRGLAGQVLTTDGAGDAYWSTLGASSSPLTTKGDLYAYSTAETRLPVGSNGQILTANSSTSTGLEWIDAGSTTNYWERNGTYGLYTTTSGDDIQLAQTNYLKWVSSINGSTVVRARNDATSLLFEDSSGGDLFEINNSGQVRISGSYWLPETNGTNGQVLTTDGSGNTSWSTGSYTLPAPTTIARGGIRIANYTGLGLVGGDILALDISNMYTTSSYTLSTDDMLPLEDAATGAQFRATLAEIQSLIGGGGGGGDMYESVYDPTNVHGDAFDMDNMVEGTNKILTTTERNNIANNTTFYTTPSLRITAGTDLSWSGNTLNYTGSGSGLTSVGLTMPTGFSVGNSPLTANGSLNVSFSAGYSLPTTTNQTNWTQAYNNYITSVGITGTTTKTITLTQRDGGTITGNFTDLTGSGLWTDYGGYISPTSGDEVTVPILNVNSGMSTLTVWQTGIKFPSVANSAASYSGYGFMWSKQSNNAPMWTNVTGTYDLRTAYFVSNSGVPSSSISAGIAGQIAYDSSYIYICIATNTWRRITIPTDTW